MYRLNAMVTESAHRKMVKIRVFVLDHILFVYLFLFPHWAYSFDYDQTFEPAIPGTVCNYHQKSQTTAFLLSLFLGEFGAGRYYVGDWKTATIKFIGLFGIACCCSIGCYMAFPDMAAVAIPVNACCFGCALTIWMIVDIVLFALNRIPDENGVQLHPWWYYLTPLVFK